MATTKQQRRFNGMKSVIAAQKRNNAKTPSPAAPAAEQQEAVVLKLEAAPVNAPATAPAAPQAPTAPEVPVVPEDPKATAEAPEVPEQKEPAAPEVPETPAAPTDFTVEQELSFIATGLKTLLGVEGDMPLTPEALMSVGLRTVRQTLMAILANDEAVEAIRGKKQELISKAKALIPPPSTTAPAAPAPAAEAVHQPLGWYWGNKRYNGVCCFTVLPDEKVDPETIIEEDGCGRFIRLPNGSVGYQVL